MTDIQDQGFAPGGDVSAYYAARVGKPSPRQHGDAELTEAISSVYEDSQGHYGAPRIHAELRRSKRRHGRKRVAWLMRAAGLAGRTPTRWKKTTVPDPHAQTRADLVGRDFTAAAWAINTRWCWDIT